MRLPVACLLASTCFVALAQPPGGGPPPEARTACAGLREGANCGIQTPHGRLAGVCRSAPEGFLCIPEAAGLPGPAPARDGPPPPGAGGRPPSVDIAARDPGARPVKSRIPDTGQGTCFDNARPIPCPRPGQPFHGQDAQYDGALPAYRNNGDGTISDRLTGLTWQQAHNPRRLGWYAARQACAWAAIATGACRASASCFRLPASVARSAAAPISTSCSRFARRMRPCCAMIRSPPRIVPT